MAFMWNRTGFMIMRHDKMFLAIQSLQNYKITKEIALREFRKFSRFRRFSKTSEPTKNLKS
jgi:hypothetical protein